MLSLMHSLLFTTIVARYRNNHTFAPFKLLSTLNSQNFSFVSLESSVLQHSKQLGSQFLYDHFLPHA